MKLVLFTISHTSGIGVLQCFSFVATVHANAILLVHWSNNVSGNEIGVIHHLSYSLMKLVSFTGSKECVSFVAQGNANCMHCKIPVSK